MHFRVGRGLVVVLGWFAGYTLPRFVESFRCRLLAEDVDTPQLRLLEELLVRLVGTAGRAVHSAGESAEMPSFCEGQIDMPGEGPDGLKLLFNDGFLGQQTVVLRVRELYVRPPLVHASDNITT